MSTESVIKEIRSAAGKFYRQAELAHKVGDEKAMKFALVQAGNLFFQCDEMELSKKCSDLYAGVLSF